MRFSSSYSIPRSHNGPRSALVWASASWGRVVGADESCQWAGRNFAEGPPGGGSYIVPLENYGHGVLDPSSFAISTRSQAHPRAAIRSEIPRNLVESHTPPLSSPSMERSAKVAGPWLLAGLIRRGSVRTNLHRFPSPFPPLSFPSSALTVAFPWSAFLISAEDVGTSD